MEERSVTSWTIIRCSVSDQFSVDVITESYVNWRPLHLRRRKPEIVDAAVESVQTVSSYATAASCHIFRSNVHVWRRITHSAHRVLKWSKVYRKTTLLQRFFAYWNWQRSTEMNTIWIFSWPSAVGTNAMLVFVYKLQTKCVCLW